MSQRIKNNMSRSSNTFEQVYNCSPLYKYSLRKIIWFRKTVTKTDYKKLQNQKKGKTDKSKHCYEQNWH